VQQVGGGAAGAGVIVRASEVARQSAELGERWIAQAGELLHAMLDADRVGFRRLDARDELSRELIVLDRAPRAAPAAEVVRQRALTLGAGGDPEDPRGRAPDAPAVVHVASSPARDGAPALELSRVLARCGLADSCALYLHDAGRVAGFFTLERSAGRPLFGAGELRLARSAQPLLQTSYVAVLHIAGQPDPSQMLREAGLSAREIEVALLLARGATNKEIAAALSRSPATINTHVTRALAKLGVRNRTELARMLSK